MRRHRDWTQISKSWRGAGGGGGGNAAIDRMVIDCI